MASNWSACLSLLGLRCPQCGHEQPIVRVGQVWRCGRCAHEWPAQDAPPPDVATE